MGSARNAEPMGRWAMWLGIAAWCLFLSTPLSGQAPKPRATFEGHTAAVLCVAISPDGKTLAAVRGAVIVDEAGRNVIKEPECIKLWEVATGKELATLKGHTTDMSSVVFSPDGKTLASGSEDGTIKLWDVTTRK